MDYREIEEGYEALADDYNELDKKFKRLKELVSELIAKRITDPEVQNLIDKFEAEYPEELF